MYIQASMVDFPEPRDTTNTLHFITPANLHICRHTYDHRNTSICVCVTLIGFVWLSHCLMASHRRWLGFFGLGWWKVVF